MNGLRLGHALLFARVMVAVVLLLAGMAKLAESRGRLRSAISAYGIPWSRLVASVLPLLEIGLGATLLIGFLMPLPALGSAGLFVAFAAGMSISLARGRVVPCACFGVNEEALTSWSRVIMNLLFAATAWVASGWPSAPWGWPIGFEPVGVQLAISDAMAVILSAIAVLVLAALSRAVVSLSGPSRANARLAEPIHPWSITAGPRPRKVAELRTARKRT